jgi:hypothetical protein
MKLIFVASALLLLGESFAAECPDVAFVKDFELKRVSALPYESSHDLPLFFIV